MFQVRDRVKAIFKKRNLVKSRSSLSQSTSKSRSSASQSTQSTKRRGSKSLSVASRFWGSQEENGGKSEASHLMGKSGNSSTSLEQLERMEKIGANAQTVVPAPTNIKETPTPQDIPTFEEFLEYILSTDLLGKQKTLTLIRTAQFQ